MPKRDPNEIFSHIAIPLYAVTAGLNVVSFLFWGHNPNTLACAILLVVLIVNQKAVDRWREAAQAWQQAAQNWRDLAERWR